MYAFWFSAKVTKRHNIESDECERHERIFLVAFHYIDDGDFDNRTNASVHKCTLQQNDASYSIRR